MAATATAMLQSQPGQSVVTAWPQVTPNGVASQNLDLLQIVGEGDKVLLNVDSNGTVHNPAVSPTTGVSAGSGGYAAAGWRRADQVPSPEDRARAATWGGWESIRAAAIVQSGEDAAVWFAELECAGVAPGRLWLTAPNAFVADWISGAYSDLICALCASAGFELDQAGEIRIEVGVKQLQLFDEKGNAQ